MFVRNKTIYPTNEVERLVKYATNSYHSAVCINIRNAQGYAYAGRAYRGVPSVSNAPRTARYLVTIRIGKDSNFPVANYYSKKFKRVPRVELQNWREGLVFTIAHEMEHIRQFVRKLPLSEVKAEKKAIARLYAYRAL